MLRTTFEYPPIPLRSFDWPAHDENTYDGAPDASPMQRLIGWGRTEHEAIADYQQQFREQADAD